LLRYNLFGQADKARQKSTHVPHSNYRTPSPDAIAVFIPDFKSLDISRPTRKKLNVAMRDCISHDANEIPQCIRVTIPWAFF
jgi:hypothetical protein